MLGTRMRGIRSEGEGMTIRVEARFTAFRGQFVHF